MAIGHEHWHEQGEIYALGALDEQELKEFEAHLASGCAICEAYVRETREALLLLHRSITPMTPSASVKTRLFDHIPIHECHALCPESFPIDTPADGSGCFVDRL